MLREPRLAQGSRRPARLCSAAPPAGHPCSAHGLLDVCAECSRTYSLDTGVLGCCTHLHSATFPPSFQGVSCDLHVTTAREGLGGCTHPLHRNARGDPVYAGVRPRFLAVTQIPSAAFRPAWGRLRRDQNPEIHGGAGDTDRAEHPVLRGAGPTAQGGVRSRRVHTSAGTSNADTRPHVHIGEAGSAEGVATADGRSGSRQPPISPAGVALDGRPVPATWQP